ncbi:3-dehydroquinate synthase [Synechococcus sp. PCC 6312]|uniref:3-dehydroquinate synthase n=1 Tax=Synechococcus sp. (strain ATCC 27167 / PCC 6312) TaxID=195253 RepID=UPI00029F0B8E|nr:3-dehydroquinate synthase [Synechococcus sp. PCC 6312]
MLSRSIPVNLPNQAYKVVIQSGGQAFLGAILQGQGLIKPGQKLLVVSNPQIFQHYGPEIIDSLVNAGADVEKCLIPAGERFKTPKTLQKIYDAALAHRLERGSALVALGGGVVGDMTGFAAATWLRGIGVIQVPTSLLAMVDAAIGGKTGVNHPQGKNLIGAFHQPRLVLIDPHTLQTLPRREFRAAMAEVIKYGVIWDAELFDLLENATALDRVQAVSEDLLAEILIRSCQAKVNVVTKDERESGLRAILNYGHTLGHALESITQYRQFNHGEAVGLGMLAAGEIAVRMGLWTETNQTRQMQLVKKVKLPTAWPGDLDLDIVLTLLTSDKKVKDGQVRFILPQAIGQVIIHDQVPATIIREAIRSLQSHD